MIKVGVVGRGYSLLDRVSIPGFGIEGLVSDMSTLVSYRPPLALIN